jgi:hypothetical protein
MVIGALATMAFFFAYTQVRTATQNVSIGKIDSAVSNHMERTDHFCIGSVYVHHQFLLECVLWHVVCLHPRSPAQCAQRYR